MFSFDPYDFGIRDRHQYIIGAVGPRPIAWASTVNENGQPNLAPYSFFNAFSSNPPLLVFSSNRRGRDNTTKDTLHNIQTNGEVVINVVNHDLVQQMSISSTDYAANINEFEKAGVTPLESVKVKPFRVKESPIQFECKVKDIIYTGEAGGAANLFLCEIVQMHISESVLDADKHIVPNKLKLVGRMGKSYYAKAFGDAVFELNNPFSDQNLGFDRLPENIRQSQVLTGNEIAQLAIQTDFPASSHVEYIRGLEEVKAAVNTSTYAAHILAQEWIQQGRIEDAFALLLS
ncbi:MAG: flavin reductase family protein [Saprospiraceae bacterium]|nr:flavin reductase family protein [Saprospiraceae bacterium]